MDAKQSKEQLPLKLDALVADPDHHILLHENDYVRVLDTCIKPGETTNVHTHQNPASLYVISWSDFVRYDPEGNILLDSRLMAMKPDPHTAIWSDPLPPHKLKNVGPDDLHVIAVEVKNIRNL